MHSSLPRRLPLEEIQAFVEVAMAGSFSAGAERLSLSHSSLSRKVAHLEDRLGVRLFERKARGVQLTVEGAAHFLRFRDALDLIGGALRQGSRAQPDTVRLSLLYSFAEDWLFPRHTRLAARTNGIRVRYLFDRRPIDFTDGTDLAIRYGLGIWQGTRGIALGEEDVQPMAGAAIAAEIGPEAILRYPLVHVGSEQTWRSWFEAQGHVYRLRSIDHVFEEQPMVVAAVRHGLGIGMSRPAGRHLVDGVTLVHVSSHVLPLQARFHLVRDAVRPLRPAARLYAEALLAEAGLAQERIDGFLN
ncbi:MAG: LysR family transcriptional regulator [Hyphomicrobiales bacterium]|uniref:LysR family transcriptional regulator n=1 Tax=Rhabdaerophilum calidifontis TaxID=2604328 RepID=UPI001238CCDD|nr:LysR family transcriptional regulator [Rhabdaerophilum calidifontis]MCA1999042.1 LysR family transcriptional regulator [Hyphomicrobiales bacterium]